MGIGTYLTASQGNLSFRQTSLTAAEELSAVRKIPNPPKKKGRQVKPAL